MVGVVVGATGVGVTGLLVGVAGAVGTGTALGAGAVVAVAVLGAGGKGAGKLAVAVFCVALGKLGAVGTVLVVLLAVLGKGATVLLVAAPGRPIFCWRPTKVPTAYIRRSSPTHMSVKSIRNRTLPNKPPIKAFSYTPMPW